MSEVRHVTDLIITIHTVHETKEIMNIFIRIDVFFYFLFKAAIVNFVI